MAYLLFAKLDGSLTSCIAVSFVFDGLVDLRIIPERNKYTLLAMLAAYAVVFVCYYKNVSSALL
jgi:hypothetical protein